MEFISIEFIGIVDVNNCKNQKMAGDLYKISWALGLLMNSIEHI